MQSWLKLIIQIKEALKKRYNRLMTHILFYQINQKERNMIENSIFNNRLINNRIKVVLIVFLKK